MNQTIIIIDFGAQYAEVIARKVRECNVYCEVLSWKTPLEIIIGKKPIGLILSGGPNSVYAANAPTISKSIFELNIPVLGICYGMQLMMQILGGRVVPAQDNLSREYGKTNTHFLSHCLLFEGLPLRSITWMSHGDVVEAIPPSFKIVAQTARCEYAGVYDESRQFYGLQFHPEVEHTTNGKEMLRKFLFNACHAQGDWSMKDFLVSTVERLKAEIGDERVLLALSGGVDSTVAAVVLSKAIGDRLICIYINHGLMRKNETEEIKERYQKLQLNVHYVDASKDFLSAIKGVEEPEQKRRIIGNMFIESFVSKAKEFGGVSLLAQGTIYPDIIESGSINGNVIKSHHNVGGLPSKMPFKRIIEPLSILFKDEVRKLGLELKLHEDFVYRQPFPGPGLAVRIIGEITEEKVAILQEADAILQEVIKKRHWNRKISQYFAVLSNMKSVGVMGDSRSYYYTIAIRAVSTSDFMTANYVKLPYSVLDEISRRIVNEVRNVNRVVYDITSKPPATIEYE